MIFGCFFRSKRKTNPSKDLEESMRMLQEADEILTRIEEASLDGEHDWFDINNRCQGALNCGSGIRKPQHQE